MERITKVTLLAQVSNYVAGLEQAKKATKDTATEADKAKAKLEAQSKVFDATGKAAIAFGAAAALGVASAVKAYAEWDAKMAQVQSLSHAGVRDMGALRDATFGFAQQFGISASQAADAEIELVKGGVSVKDMINGGLKGALTLAAAGQLDVGDATSIAVSAMTQFHLKGQDVSHVADLLAAGADKALGSVSDLGQGLKYVGPVASSMGISIEQTVGTLSELAQNGILADQAGTSLRGMLSSLTSPSQQAAAVMKQYGISVYDTSGKFVGFDGVAQQLKTHMKGLDEATRNQALGQIFGNQQITAATVLMQNGAKGVDQWTKAVNAQGFATEQASGKLDSLTGNWARFTAQVQDDLVQTGSASGGILNAALKGATDLAAAYGNLPQPLKDVVLALGGITAAVGLLGGATVLAVPKIVEFDAALATMGAKPALITSGLKGMASFLAGPWGLGIAAGAASLGILTAAAKTSDETLAHLQNTAKTDPAKLWQQSVSGATDSTWGKKALFGGFDIDGTQKQLKQVLDLKAQLDKNFAKGFWDVEGTGPGFTQVNGIADSLRDMGKALTNLANTDLPSAQKAWKAFAQQNDLSARDQWRALNQMPEFKSALENQATQLDVNATKSNLLKIALGQLGGASSDAASSSDKVASSADQISSAMSDAKQATDDLMQSLQNLDNGQVDAASAQVAFQQAIADATQAAKDNGATLDENTQKGRDNETQLLNIAKSAESLISSQYNATAATGDFTAAQQQATATTQQARDAFIKVAESMGVSAGDAANLADKYGLIPGKVTTTIVASGAATAASQAAQVKAAVDAIPDVKTVRIQLSGDQGVKVSASTIMKRDGGVVDYYANGGIEQHVAQIAPAGAWRMWAEPETGGEAYIPLAPSKRSRSIAIWEETGRRLQAFAGGGISAPSVNVAASPVSLDGVQVSLDVGGQKILGVMHTVAQHVVGSAAATDARTIRNGRRRY